MNCRLYFLSRVPADVIDKTASAAPDKPLERITDTRNGTVVELDEAICKGDQQKKIEELGNVEPWTTLRGGKRLLYSKPNEHDGGQRKNHMNAKGVHRRSHRRSEVIATVFDQDEEIHIAAFSDQ
jgi:hypothetical protein